MATQTRPKKVGLISGAALGAVVLLAAIGGVLVRVSSSGEHRRDRGLRHGVRGQRAARLERRPLALLQWGLHRGRPEASGTHGVLSCEGGSGGLVVTFHVELLDTERPETEAEMTKALEEGFDRTEGLGTEGIEQGVVDGLDHGFGPKGKVLWDENTVGEGVTIASTMDGGEYDDTGGFGAGAFLSGNAVGGVAVGVCEGGVDVEEPYSTVEASLVDLEGRIPRVSE